MRINSRRFALAQTRCRSPMQASQPHKFPHVNHNRRQSRSTSGNSNATRRLASRSALLRSEMRTQLAAVAINNVSSRCSQAFGNSTQFAMRLLLPRSLTGGRVSSLRSQDYCCRYLIVCCSSAASPCPPFPPAGRSLVRSVDNVSGGIARYARLISFARQEQELRATILLDVGAHSLPACPSIPLQSHALNCRLRALPWMLLDPARELAGVARPRLRLRSGCGRVARAISRLSAVALQR